MEDSKVAVLLEDLSSQFRIFGEGLNDLRHELREFKQEVYARFDAIEIRLDRIEHRLDEHDKRFDKHDTYFERNTQEHRQLMQAILELNKDIQGGLTRAR